MRRTVGDKRPRVKPVQKIELSTTDTKRRIIFAALFLIIGLAALGFSISNFIGMGTGWTEMGANPAAETNCANEFTFMYNLGQDGNSPTVENKTITAVYTDAMVLSYKLFNTDAHFDGVTNLFDINHHANEVLKVDDVIYRAFSTIQEYGNRNIYLAPIYEEYENIFYCNDEAETVNFDPYQNREVSERFAEIAEFARNEQAVNIELLEDNQIRLVVSDEYRDYAEENYITNYIDFNWMKNAFILDYVAEVMTERGFTHGILSSVEGFSRDLGAADNNSRFCLYDRIGNSIYAAGQMEYEGTYSIIYMRAFAGLKKEDTYRYYEMSDGSVRTRFLDTADGLCKNAVDELALYARNVDCAELLMQSIPVFIAEELDKEQLKQLAAQGIGALFCGEQTIYFTEKDMKLVDLYQNDNMVYKSAYLN